MKFNKFTILSISLISVLAACGNTNNPSINLESNNSFDSTIISNESSVNSEIITSEDIISSEDNISSSNNSSMVSSSNKPSSSESFSGDFEDNTSNEIISGTQTETLNIVNYGGHLESAFAEFYPVKNATGYNAYYKLSSDASWVQIDTELIRNYGDYYRVDALGLKEGNYKVKITPIISSIEATSKGKIIDVSVRKHQREGYGFVNKPVANAFGAYNDDGTLRSGAQVIYVSKDTAKTVTASVNGATHTGFQSIIDAMQKVKNPPEILNFRIIGTIDVNDLDHYSSSSEGLQIKGKSEGSNMNITIEGVGNDATFYGFGMLIRNCANVEVRNIGFMNYMDDGISIDTDNRNLWIHNNDFFYGKTGGDSDQAKGDGALDTKSSSHITHSYNHFWDTGKSNLQGMTSESTENSITYHHNWFDHSDSRHPRVRTCTVHVFNNYYDGVSKYGIGATMGSSIYVEGNYFRNTKYPMLISLQGSDIGSDGKGTFSGETGGMIKAYDNEIINATKFVSYSENNTEFDAYVASSREEIVPSNVKTKSGGNTYSNFDTDSSFYEYSYESPEKAKETTTKYAGRVQGGDFKWTFTSADDASYDVNSALKNAINSYKSSLVSVGGNSIEGSTTVDASEVIKMIDDLENNASLNNIEEIKSVYETYLIFGKEEISNADKIERLYKEALALEVERCKELIDLLDTNLSKENLDNALNYYNSLSDSQKKELANYKTKLDNKIKEYEAIAASEVVKLIDALPSDITLENEHQVNVAYDAYNALTDEQKSQVNNYNDLVAAINKINELKNKDVADKFIERINALPNSENELKASDLAIIESLINEYNSFDDSVKALIDNSYIEKLYNYKNYINNNLINEVSVSLTISDLNGNKSGTTSSGFTYSTNGESDGYIKVKGANYLSYEVETSSITMELVAKCIDSSDSKTFTVTISYADGTTKDFTYSTSTGKLDKTYNETFTGNITGIKVNGIEGKNLGVKSLKLTYNK